LQNKLFLSEHSQAFCSLKQGITLSSSNTNEVYYGSVQGIMTQIQLKLLKDNTRKVAKSFFMALV
jgi:hypothetical protein